MRKVRVASAQFFSGTDVAANLDLCRHYIAEASTAGAQVVVLPENSNRVRDYLSREACYELAESCSGPFMEGIRQAARDGRIHVVVNVDMQGEQPPDVHITSVLVDDAGEILARHRKHILWDYEYTLFQPGEWEMGAIDTRLGRIGLISCADGLIPEPARLLGVAGAELVFNSLNSRGPDELRVHIPLRAAENGYWVVSSNTVGGPPDGWPWMGGSQIASPAGKTLLAASETEPQLICADIDLDASTAARSDPDGPWASRRPELYRRLTEELKPAQARDATLSVALLQVSLFHNEEWTILRAERQIAYASRRGAQVGVLPELFAFAPGAVGDSPSAHAERSALILERLAKACRENRIMVVASLVERAGGDYFHTAHLIDSDGEVVGSYRKAHLDLAERAWARPGDQLPVFETRLGRFGLMVGEEVWIPEVARVLSLQGAELILHPCSWQRPESAALAATERVEENRVHLASSARLDSPAGIGSQLVVCNPYWPDAPIALMRYPMALSTRPGFEETLVHTVNLQDTHQKLLGKHLDVFGRRMPHLYGPLADLNPTADGQKSDRQLREVP